MMVPRLKPTPVCPGPLLLTPAVFPAAEAGTTTSLAFSVHTSTHTCDLTLSAVFLSIFDLPLRFYYNFPSSRKSSWCSCRQFSIPLHPEVHSPALGGESSLPLMSFLAARKHDLCCVHFWESSPWYVTIYRAPSSLPFLSVCRIAQESAGQEQLSHPNQGNWGCRQGGASQILATKMPCSLDLALQCRFHAKARQWMTPNTYLQVCQVLQWAHSPPAPCIKRPHENQWSHTLNTQSPCLQHQLRPCQRESPQDIFTPPRVGCRPGGHHFMVLAGPVDPNVALEQAEEEG